MSVYERIKETAKTRGMSLQTVAEKSGLSANMIYQYKNVNPKLDTSQKIAKVLGVSVDYLLGNTDDTMPVQKEPSKPLSETQEFTLMAAHWGNDLSELDEADRKKVIEKAKTYVTGLIDALKD